MFLTLGLAATTALAQLSVPPPPQPTADKPAASGPTIEATMNFIENKVNAVGTVSFSAYIHDSSNNSDWTQKISSTISSAVANPGACSIRYHRLVTNNGKTEHDEDVVINMHEVQSITVMTDAQDWQSFLAHSGDNAKSVKEDPEIFALVVKLSRGTEPTLRFFDQEMANRVAKAMIHAVDLCGGGSAPEPF
jgi:hypothetical protein